MHVSLTPMFPRSPHSYWSESGVIIPLVAVISLSVFVVLMVLGIDAAQVHRKSAFLRQEAIEICKIAVDVAPIQGAAAISFATQVNALNAALQSQGVRLDRARIILPTMAGLAARPSGFGTTEMNNDYTGNKIPFLAGPQNICNAGALLSAHPVCTNSNSFCASADPDNAGFQRCIFQGDVHYNNPRFAPGSPVNSTRYPVSMMHNLSHAGNTAICELEASIASTLIPNSRRSFRGVAGWRIPAVGYFDTRPSDPWSFPTDVPYPGLSVAIAPHMTTWTDVSGGGDNRFQFLNSLYTGNAQDNGPWTRYQNLTSNLAMFTNNSGTATFPSSSSSLTALSALSNNDREDLLTACANPATLTRNIFSSIILELASRHGMMRKDTELLLVGTQDRNLSAIGNLPARSNFPVLIAPMDSDIAFTDFFQLPFVSYYSGTSTIGGLTATDNISNGTTFASGYVDPFGQIDSSGATTYSALLSNQLRFCYHLYTNNNSNSSLPRHAALPKDAGNANFEDPGVFQDLLQPPGLRTNSLLPNTPWAQPCPWNTDLSGCFPLNDARRLSAAEAASALGTIQSCPYQIFNNVASSACNKNTLKIFNDNIGNAGTATTDLRPDLVGLLRYLARDNYVGGAAFPALVSPGMFPYAVSGSPANFSDVNYPFTSSLTYPAYQESYASDSAGNPSSTILIILHQRINSGDVGPIGLLVDRLVTTDLNGTLQRRPITIAYFPTTAADADPAAILNLQNAFRANIAAADPRVNSLLVYGPSQLAAVSGSAFGPTYIGCAGNSACQFREYWKHLLTLPPTDNDSIFMQAREVFRTRLVHKGVLF